MVAESEYDRYEYDYEESPNDQRRKENSCEKLRSCCSDMGRLTKSVNTLHCHQLSYWTIMAVLLVAIGVTCQLEVYN